MPRLPHRPEFVVTLESLTNLSAIEQLELGFYWRIEGMRSHASFLMEGTRHSERLMRVHLENGHLIVMCEGGKRLRPCGSHSCANVSKNQGFPAGQPCRQLRKRNLKRPIFMRNYYGYRGRRDCADESSRSPRQRPDAIRFGGGETTSEVSDNTRRAHSICARRWRNRRDPSRSQLGGLGMPYSFLRGRWLRVVTTCAVVSLSFATVDPLRAADGPNAAGAGANGQVEIDDPAHYPGLTFVKPGVSTKVMRKQATSEIPMDRLSPEGQRKSLALLKNVGMYRRLPTISFECDPEIYRYFLTHPDVAVSSWRAMEISQFQLQELDPYHYRADAGDGSVGSVELLLSTPTETLIHCDGAFKSPLLPKPIVARSLMRLQTSFAKTADGRIVGTHTGDVFVEFPSPTVETVAKVIAPVSHSIADRNFKQMTLFVHLMSQAMGRHPGWIEQIGNKMEGISPQKKQEFLEVSARSAAEARRRQAIANGHPGFSPEELLVPFRQFAADDKVAPAGAVQLSSGAAPTRTAQAIVHPTANTQKR